MDAGGKATEPIEEQESRHWLELVRAGRPSEALTQLLQEPNPDPDAARLLEQLSDLRGFLRAKEWERARRSAEGLSRGKADEVAHGAAQGVAHGARSVLHDAEIDHVQLGAELERLEASGKQLERGEAEGALELLQGVSLPLLAAEVETQRGTAQIFLGDAEAAKDTFARALTHDPKHYRAQTNLGNVALEEGRIDDAIALYEGALKLSENFPNAHHNLGVAYRRKGQISRSVKSIRRAQRVTRQRDRDEARSAVRSLGKNDSGRTFRWVLYAVAVVGLFILLRTQGIV